MWCMVALYIGLILNEIEFYNIIQLDIRWQYYFRAGDENLVINAGGNGSRRD